MIKFDDYSEYSEVRYKALYDRIYYYQESLFSQWTESSRDPSKGYEMGSMLYAFFLGLKVEEGLKEAIDAFDFAYPLWHSMPDLMKEIEPIRLKMLHRYLKSESPEMEPETTKVVQRYKIWGFIPWLPKIEEVYDSSGELIRRKYFYLNLDKSKLKAFKKAITEEERIGLGWSIYGVEKIEGVKPIEIEGMSILGEPTRKKLFQTIVKYRAIHDFINHIRVSDSSNFKKFKEKYETALDFEINKEVTRENEPIIEETKQESIETIESSRKRQALGYYYLLTAGGVKGINANKAEFARFIAFMSAYDPEVGDGKAKNIHNSSFYRIIKTLFGQKTQKFNDDDLDAIIRSFEKLDNGESTILHKAIELIKKDREAQE